MNVFDREITPAHLLIRLGAAPSAGQKLLGVFRQIAFRAWTPASCGRAGVAAFLSAYLVKRLAQRLGVKESWSGSNCRYIAPGWSVSKE
jgi:hypothetical protein